MTDQEINEAVAQFGDAAFKAGQENRAMLDDKINEAVAIKLGAVLRVKDCGAPFCEHSVPLIPDYCADIAAAWEVVEKMPEGFCMWEAHRLWRVKILDEMGTGKILSEADTAPMAICLAFLKLP